MLGRYRVDPERDETYAPELTAFFYFLSALKPHRLSDGCSWRTRTSSCEPSQATLSSSRYILIKHRWVNRAFILTGLTLGFFLCTGLDYLLRVHLTQCLLHSEPDSSSWFIRGVAKLRLRS